ncbi:MAG: hypothetical protein V1701_02620 [Planctomycetota bacterium]
MITQKQLCAWIHEHYLLDKRITEDIAELNIIRRKLFTHLSRSNNVHEKAWARTYQGNVAGFFDKTIFRYYQNPAKRKGKWRLS